jgi:hypothetical protein
VEAGHDIDIGHPHSDDVEAYEQLRQHALSGQPGGWRLGLAVAHHHGLVAWMRVRQQALPERPTQPAGGRGGRSQPIPGAEQLVDLLASMALSAAGG